MTPSSMTLTVTFMLKNSLFLTLLLPGAFMFHKHTCFYCLIKIALWLVGILNILVNTQVVFSVYSKNFYCITLHSCVQKNCTFLCPRNGIRGYLVFVLSVCHSVLKKNFNFNHNFWTIRDRDFIFGMYIELMKPFQMTPKLITSWPWPLTYISKNFNRCHNFWTIRGRALLLHVYIPFDEVFPLLQKVLALWPWPWPLTYISKTLNLAIIFER